MTVREDSGFFDEIHKRMSSRGLSGSSFSEDEDYKERYIPLDEAEKMESYLCEDLKREYDASLIDKMPYQLQKSIRDFSREELNCLNKRPARPGIPVRDERPVLKRLVNNHFYRPTNPTEGLPKTKFIGGPKNLTVHWGKGFNMLVYIFGEGHQEKVDCASKFPEEIKGLDPDNPEHFRYVDDYMQQIFRYTPKYLDYGIELPTTGRGNFEYSLPTNIMIGKPEFRLNKLFQKFKECIQPSTRHKTECQLGRVHFFDVRRDNILHSDDISLLLNSFLSIESDMTKIIDILKNRENIRILNNLNKCLVTENKFDVYTYFNAHIFGNPYNVVEMERLRNPKHVKDFISKEDAEFIRSEDVIMADELSAFIRSEIRERVNTFYEILKENIGKILDYYEKKIQKYGFPKDSSQIPIYITDCFVAIIPGIVSISCISPDLYLLARLFKTFNLSKPAFQGAIYQDQPIKAYNVVIYAGDQHAQRYRRFLNFQDFKEVGKTGQSEGGKDHDSCINMEYIHQPFFSEESKVPMVVPEHARYMFNYKYRYNIDDPVSMEWLPTPTT